MFNETLNNYLMKPTVMSNGLKIYPIKLMDYEEFKELFAKYFLLDIKAKNNRLYQEWEKNFRQGEIIKITEDNLFDFTINLIKNNRYINETFSSNLANFKNLNSEELEHLINNNPEIVERFMSIQESNIEGEIIKLLKMLFKEEVFFQDDVFKVGKYELNKDNFYEFRDIVMRANLLYEPLVAPNLRSQKGIDRALESRTRNGIESELASIVSIVKSEYKVTDEEVMDYTYYRLMYDFNIASRKHIDMFMYMLRSQGCSEAQIEYLCEPVKLYKNPYEDLFSKGGNSSLDKKLN